MALHKSDYYYYLIHPLYYSCVCNLQEKIRVNNKKSQRHSSVTLIIRLQQWHISLSKQVTKAIRQKTWNCWSVLPPGESRVGNCKFWLWVQPPNLPFSWGVRDTHLTQCVIGPHNCTHQMASKYIEWFWQITLRRNEFKYVKSLPLQRFGLKSV